MGETLTVPRVVRQHEFEASRLRNEEISYYWPWMEKELDRVPHIWCGHWTKESLYELTLNERFQLWGFGPKDEIRIFVFTQIIHFPANRVLQAFLCFGNSLDQALPIIEATFERFAMETGCKLFELVGRKAWERKLKGFRHDYTVLSKSIELKGVH